MAKVVKTKEDLDNLLEDYHFMPQDYELIDIPTRFEFDEDIPASSFMHDVWVRFRSNKGAIIGGCVIVFFIIVSIIAPMCSQYSFDAVDTAQQSMAPRIPGLTWMSWFNGEGGIRTYTGDLANTYHFFGTLDAICGCAAGKDAAFPCSLPAQPSLSTYLSGSCTV